jgi:chromosome segregation ATPase
MAENVSPANINNAAVELADDNTITADPLGTLNGNSTPKNGKKPRFLVKEKDSLVQQRLKTKNALKELAQLKTKHEELSDLLDSQVATVGELNEDLKAEKKASTSAVRILKNLHKKELKAKADEGVTKFKAQLLLTKEVESIKKGLDKKLFSNDKTIELLRKAFSDSKRRGSELSSDIMSVTKDKDALKLEIKDLKKQLNTHKKKFDNQLEQKNSHQLEMQRMKNANKQMGLDELREKMSSRKEGGGGGKGGPMSLEAKKEFVTHQAFIKQQSKDADLARAVLKKDNKKKENYSNMNFAASMLHNQSNPNGGMWSSNSVNDVSCC